MKDLCIIISGGEFSPLPEDIPQPSYVIACDRGYAYAERLGIVPDLIVGDFDSAPQPETDIPIELLPTRKDDTDTMRAARRAIERGYKNIAVCCAFGGRLDHTMANIQTGAWMAERGAVVRLLGTDTDAWIFGSGEDLQEGERREIRPARRDGWSLSVFALTDRCESVTIKGTKFECEDVTVTNAFPIGVSNVWESGEASVSVAEGILMVMQSRLKPGEHI